MPDFGAHLPIRPRHRLLAAAMIAAAAGVAGCWLGLVVAVSHIVGPGAILAGLLPLLLWTTHA